MKLPHCAFAVSVLFAICTPVSAHNLQDLLRMSEQLDRIDATELRALLQQADR